MHAKVTTPAVRGVPGRACSTCITSWRPAATIPCTRRNGAWQQRLWQQQQQQPHHWHRPSVLLCQATQQPHASSTSKMRPIEVSRSIAAARAAESSRPDALVMDPHAALLAGSSNAEQQQEQQALLDVIATRYIDESLLNAMAATNVNSIQGGDYRQVVLLGDGMDCRPFRLPWPPGTLLFLVAPPEVHEQAEALLASAAEPPHVMRGCLLRRVNMNMAALAAAAAADAGVDPIESNGSSSSSRSRSSNTPAAEDVAAGGAAQLHYSQAAVPSTIFSAQLARAGFRADRLSVWVLQGLHSQGLSRYQLQQLLAEVTNCAAFHSLLVGELPGPMSKQDAENLLAEAGLLGAVFSHEQEGYGRWQQQQQGLGAGANMEWREKADSAQGHIEAGGATAGDGGLADRWLCTGQQLRLSLEQMGIYDKWSSEFADADAGDDFIGNYS